MNEYSDTKKERIIIMSYSKSNLLVLVHSRIGWWKYKHWRVWQDWFVDDDIVIIVVATFSPSTLPGRANFNKNSWPDPRSGHWFNFFLFPFWKEKSLIFLEGKSMTPHQGNTILFRSSQQLPRLRLGPSKGFLSWHGALLGPSTCLVRCFRNYRDTRTPSGVTC